MVHNNILKLPTPLNITFFWNFGSLLGLSLAIQVVTGIFLAMHFNSEISTAFLSVDEIARNVNNGWLVRLLHGNGASMFFFSIYLHMGRGIYYSSYAFSPKTWLVGSTIFLMSMATAFLGYVLPWGQMSLWGATVITNLFSVIPAIGEEVVFWLWGGFSVEAPTLTRFFAFHFLLPFLISFLVVVHLMFLHEKGSSNPLGISGNFLKVHFSPYFSIKDLLGGLFFVLFLFFLVFFFPWIFGDPENFIEANPMMTPVHIQPEWYFLFAYAILRSIPSKLGGVVALLLSVVMLFVLLLFPKSRIMATPFNPLSQFIFWQFIGSFILLTWIGAKPADGIYVSIGQGLTGAYFNYFSSLISIDETWWEVLS